MRQFVLLFAITTLSACLIPEGDRDTRGGKHTLTIDWHLKGPGGVPLTACPPGFEHLLLSATTLEAGGQVQTLVPCQTSGSHAVELYTSGERNYYMDDDPVQYVERFTENYEVIIYLTDPTSTVNRAESLGVRVKLDADKAVTVDLYPDAGIMLLSWGLTSGITGQQVYNCQAVAIDEVELRYRVNTFEDDPMPPPSQSVRWPCEEKHDDQYYMSDSAVGQGFTPALAPGSYAGEFIGYRNGVEIVRHDEAYFNINTANELTEDGEGLTVPDR